MSSPVSVAGGLLVAASCAVLSIFLSPEEITAFFQKEDSASTNTEIVHTSQHQTLLDKEPENMKLLLSNDNLWNSAKNLLNVNNLPFTEEGFYGKILAAVLVSAVFLFMYLLVRRPKAQIVGPSLTTSHIPSSSVTAPQKEQSFEVLPLASSVAKEQPSLEVELGPQEQRVQSKNVPSSTSTANESIQEVESQVADLQNQHEQEKLSFIQTINDLNLQNDELKRIMEDRDSTISEFRNKEEEFNAYVVKVENEKQEAQQNYETSMEELKTEAMDKINSMESTITQLKTDLEERDSRLSLYENAVVEKDTEIQNLKEELEKMKQALLNQQEALTASVGTVETSMENDYGEKQVQPSATSSSLTIDETSVDNSTVESEAIPTEDLHMEEIPDTLVTDPTQPVDLFSSTTITADYNDPPESTVNESLNASDTTETPNTEQPTDTAVSNLATEPPSPNNFDIPSSSDLKSSKSTDDLNLASEGRTASHLSASIIENGFTRPKRNSLPASYFKLAKQWYQSQERAENFSSMQV